MTRAGLQEVIPGHWLGNINLHGPEGDVIETAGELTEGIIPEDSLLASPNVHAYIASNKVSDTRIDKVVIGVEEDPSGLATIAVETDQALPGYEVAPALIKGGLAAIIGLDHIRRAKLDQGTPEEVAKAAQAVGFRQTDSGELVFGRAA